MFGLQNCALAKIQSDAWVRQTLFLKRVIILIYVSSSERTEFMCLTIGTLFANRVGRFESQKWLIIQRMAL